VKLTCKKSASSKPSGASIIIAGVLVALILPLIPLIMPSLVPSSPQAGLEALKSQELVYGITWALYLVSDILYLVAFFELYYALRQQGLGDRLLQFFMGI
jgi:hypothetical protein